MSTLTRRPNAAAAATADSRERSGSTIWEDEADAYWRTMEPARRAATKRFPRALMFAIVTFAIAGATVLTVGPEAVRGWKELGLAAFRNRFPPPSPMVSNASIATAIATPADDTLATIVSNQPPPATAAIPATPDIDQVRSRCRVRGVQTRWHEETCRRLCQRDPHHSACMNGCSYGSLTVTKLTCDELAPAAAAFGRCPDGVSCAGACRAYDSEKPFPAVRSACERGCANVVPAACARVVQIYRDLLSGAAA